MLRPTTPLTRVELLVRETLQNSWDARDDEWYPAYGVRVNRLEDFKRNILLNCIFTDLPESLAQIRRSLQSPDVHLVEIYDRGTSGLVGPFHASEEAAPGSPNKFNSFVFDIGTTSSSEVAGGTYGFGKTAAFEVSKTHSVVYWSRCRGDDGELEHRFIASSLHDAYAEEGKRYTGAHWWGVASEEDVIPLRGAEAEALGNALFHNEFGEDETGTSILIIDPEISFSRISDAPANERMPVRTEEHVDELVRQVSEALAHNAWPKTIPADGINSPMIIELYRDAVSQGVAASIRSHYSRWADTLIQVRRMQGQQTEDDGHERPSGIIRETTEKISLRPGPSLNASQEDIFGGRKDRVVGHLHLTSSIGVEGLRSPTVDKNRLCLMRSNAELVVRYDEFTDADDDAIQWHGVFKPTPECDRHFAAAEPPTHDSWTPRAAEKEVSTYVVDKALQQIRIKTRRFLAENGREQKDGEQSVRKVALALRSFVPAGQAPEDASTSAPRTRNARHGGKKGELDDSTVTVIESKPLSRGVGQELTVLPETRGASPNVNVTATVYARSSEGRMLLNEDEVSIIWHAGDGAPSAGNDCVLMAGLSTKLELRTQVTMALEVDLNVEAI